MLPKVFDSVSRFVEREPIFCPNRAKDMRFHEVYERERRNLFLFLAERAFRRFHNRVKEALSVLRWIIPFTRRDHFTAKDLKMVVIDPYVSWGRAVLRDTGIPTSMIIQRFWAGDSIVHLADDYGRDTTEIEEAIRCELEAAAA